MRQIETSMFPALPSGREDHVFGVNEPIAPADADDYCRPTALKTAREFHLLKASHEIRPEGSNGA
jgi:hypothetical protein